MYKLIDFIQIIFTIVTTVFFLLEDMRVHEDEFVMQWVKFAS